MHGNEVQLVLRVHIADRSELAVGAGQVADAIERMREADVLEVEVVLHRPPVAQLLALHLEKRLNAMEINLGGISFLSRLRQSHSMSANKNADAGEQDDAGAVGTDHLLLVVSTLGTFG